MAQVSPQTVIFAAGGTSGHIHPALAIAERLKVVRPEMNLIFCGTADGLEAHLVPRAGFAFCPIKAERFPRRVNGQLAKAIRAYQKGRQQAADLIRQHQTVAVVGTGGFVCGPLLGAAKQLGVPRLIHEQNAYPGRSNRLMSRGAELVCISYEQTRSYFKRAQQVICTGNPVQEVFKYTERAQARARLGLPLDQKIILAMGGSLGAAKINQTVLSFLKSNPDFDALVIMACGQKMYEETLAKSAGLQPDRIQVHPYLYNMHLYMAAADCLICRAGAITCAEIAALGRAAILVPYPYAAADHQTVNAKAYSDIGAAILCPDQDLTVDWLENHLFALIHDDEKRKAIETAVYTQAKPDAVKDIVTGLCQLIDKGGASID